MQSCSPSEARVRDTIPCPAPIPCVCGGTIDFSSHIGTMESAEPEFALLLANCPHCQTTRSAEVPQRDCTTGFGGRAFWTHYAIARNRCVAPVFTVEIDCEAA